MPTYAQLQSEVWWGREFQPPTLAELCRRLREFYHVTAVALGSKGDNNHLRGYHRSYAWIKNSVYCTNRTYSVSETTGNRTPGDVDWLCAVDMTIPSAELIAACRRLDVACRAGRLEKITQWFGNTGGDNLVDGWDNINNKPASSDDSHLWHLHMSFDRARAGEDHSDLYDILTGDDMALDEVVYTKPAAGTTPADPRTVREILTATDVRTNATTNSQMPAVKADVAAVQSDVDVLTAKVDAQGVDLDAANAKLDAIIGILSAGNGSTPGPTVVTGTFTGNVS